MTELPPNLNDRDGDDYLDDNGMPLEGTPLRRAKRRRLILRSTAVLPALFTLGNALFGFASIHFATKDGIGQATLTHLCLAAWMIFLAMVCDMLDGRVARMTRHTSEFGAQLDSLADAVSFGAAPAVLMLRAVLLALRGGVERLNLPQDMVAVERVAWCIAAVYLACALLRLARFNVENEPDESAHMSFKGLPSPGAAAAVAAVVLLFVDLADPQHHDWRAGSALLLVVAIVLPVITLLGALLMVSRFRYPHVVNQYLRGKRPFSYLVKIVILLAAGILAPYVTAAVIAVGFALSGLVGGLWLMLRKKNPSHASPHAR